MSQQHTKQAVEEWMLVCQRNTDLQPDITSQQDFDWTLPAQAYPSLEQMPSFIAQQRQSAPQHTFTTTADPHHLTGKQLEAYNIMLRHVQAESPPPLHMIVSGTAGTGKSYLIHCLRVLLDDKVRVAVPTGVAAFNIDGHTLHSLLSLPTKGDFKDLQGDQLQRMQQALTSVKYLIIDEMSMHGGKESLWTPFSDFVRMRTQCLVPRPKTTVIGLETRLAQAKSRYAWLARSLPPAALGEAYEHHVG